MSHPRSSRRSVSAAALGADWFIDLSRGKRRKNRHGGWPQGNSSVNRCVVIVRSLSSFRGLSLTAPRQVGGTSLAPDINIGHRRRF